ncbi:MFS transporter [Streptomyces sp. NPDC047000]|uniref:MFS transporter n=1 Tax=Streptomyces sp. NPDC047000 TaxID=3155474 RepID=UPI0033EFFDE8
MTDLEVGRRGRRRRSPAGEFGRLWAAYAVSSLGTRLAFDAFPLVAIRVLHSGAAQVSALAAAGTAVGAVVAVPLGPWVEFRRKRPVMIAMDLIRCAALLTVPAAFALGVLTFAQLLVVSVVVAAADIAFGAASGAFLKTLLPRRDLLKAGARLESTTWTTTVLGPPLGGAAIGLFGPVATVVADAVSYLLSAAGIGTMSPDTEGGSGGGSRSGRAGKGSASGSRPRPRDVLEGWRHILAHPVLRPLFFNTVLVNGLIMAVAPPLAVLMLGPLGFPPWQYGLAFAVPCLGGLVGARLSRPLVARYGGHRVLRTAGALRACWSLGLAFVRPGTAGLVLVMVVEFGLITCIGVFNPVLATLRLELTPAEKAARTLSAWSVTGKASIAALTAAWGVLSAVTTTRTALAAAGLLLLATPLLLPRRAPAGAGP